MAAITFNIAQLMSQTPMQRTPTPSTADQDDAQSMALPTDQPAKLTAEFRPLDAGIVSEAIPAFFIGRNRQGFWVARDAKGRIGGVFLLENSARSFARKSSRPLGCATIFLSERFELDLENSGNPLVPYFTPWMRVARQIRQRASALIARMTEAVQRRLQDFHVL
jgi:hypothetical protein